MTKNLYKHILIVDDEEMVRTTVKEFLERMGYSCNAAKDPSEAISLIYEKPIELVLSDIMMPNMDGVQFMKEVKTHFPHLEFIMMTGFDNQYSYMDIIESGAADYMSKPFEMKELYARLKRIEREKAALLDLKKANINLEHSIKMANEASHQAEAANRAKSQFLANMSHEIRTPLNAIIGFTEMVFDTPLNNDQAEYLNIIRNSGETLLALINDVLDFSKIEASELDFEEIDFDPELLAYDVCEMIRPKTEPKRIEIVCHIGDDVPSLVRGDPLRFRQVLTNLLGNAPKFTEFGEIQLTLDLEEEDHNRVKLHTTIRDTGIGIPREKLEIIFEPFQQGDGSTTRKFGGTGLGLSICKQISNLMEGDVWAESAPHKGSTFHFTAWLGKVEGKNNRKRCYCALTGKKVLLVDDNETTLHLLEHFLERAGMHVIALKNGRDVVPSIDKAFKDGEPFDLGIIDIYMSPMDGYEVADEIVKWVGQSLQKTETDPITKHLPLIAISSFVNRNAKQCESAGFSGFLSKPIQKEKLYRMLERVLGRKEGEECREESCEGKIITRYSIRDEIKQSVRILLTEDNPVNQKLTETLLLRAGYQVEIAVNGQEAIEKYTRAPDHFDLIFMDIQMPGMDGMEATKAIREWENRHMLNHSNPYDRGIVPEKSDPAVTGSETVSRVPIIAMTANAMKGDREKCLAAGMEDYITKPIKREAVFAIIEERVLKKKFPGL
ncbi:MAG: response regulator [Deltaproteobacteria bacterium]|nr:response regulator [Deltaproteobacteria bacterium]